MTRTVDRARVGAHRHRPAPTPEPASRSRRARPPAPAAPTPSVPRMAGLDGIRGWAVLAVILYHAGVTWIPGGLLGVDAFFVLSGFLITTLLVTEWRGSGRVDLRRFWGRRARRLLPALLVLLVAVSCAAGLVEPAGGGASLRADALSALAYVANWRFALSDQGYFAHFTAPSPLLHLWSLGVEEQFYVLWPTITTLVLARQRRRRGHRALLTAAAIGALASTALMVLLHHLGVGTSRLYYGTDTRAASLLVGAGLAAWRVHRPAAPSRASRRTVTVLGWIGVAVVVACFLRVGGQSGWLYDGGFALVALAVAGVIGAAVDNPRGVLTRSLCFPPLAFVGRISYGLYLWHWPLFLALTHARTGLSGPALLAVRLAATLAFACASWYLLEQPIRRHRFHVPRPRLAVPAAVGAVIVAILLAGLSGGTASATDLDRDAARQAALAASALAHAKPKTPTRPPTVLLVGDSVALTLGMSLPTDYATTYGINIVNEAKIGCGIAPGDTYFNNSVDLAPLKECVTWPTDWANDVNRLRPDVSALLVGRWETVNRKLNGVPTNIGQPAYDLALQQNLEKAITVLGSHSAKVALITTPCFAQEELPDGSLDPENNLSRVQLFDTMLRQAAARHPGKVEIVDLAGKLCPGGHFLRTVDGVSVRDTDGIHINVKEAGPVIAPFVLPRLRQIAGRTPYPAKTS